MHRIILLYPHSFTKPEAFENIPIVTIWLVRSKSKSIRAENKLYPGMSFC